MAAGRASSGAAFSCANGYDRGMDPKEIDDLIARIDRLKTRQTEIEAMQRKMSEQAGSVRKAIAAQESTLRELKTVVEKKQPEPPTGAPGAATTRP
jgi:seryl-tRNA synthetase